MESLTYWIAWQMLAYGVAVFCKGSLEGLRACAERSLIGLQFFEHLTTAGSKKPYVGCLEGCEKRAWVV